MEGRLYHTLSSAEKEEVEQWQERFTVGQCLSATVFSTRDNRLDLSLVGTWKGMWELPTGKVCDRVWEGMR